MVDDRLQTDDEFADFAPSGVWTGFYVQGSGRHDQRMHLKFASNRVLGSGFDRIGAFWIRGTYDVESLEVRWVKSYRERHDVYYRGFREIQGIWGTWEIGSALRGGFHVWPWCEGETRVARAAAAEPRGVVLRFPLRRGESSP